MISEKKKSESNKNIPKQNTMIACEENIIMNEGTKMELKTNHFTTYFTRPFN